MRDPGMSRLDYFFSPLADERTKALRIRIFHVIAVATMILALNYIVWRYLRSLNMNALWFAIPMVIAETYGIIENLLFIFMVWKPADRVVPVPPETADLDVFVVTYNEPVELVGMTIYAATRNNWENKEVFVLDDGDRPEMRAIAASFGCGCITRSEEWKDKPRHAKAGNLNNALQSTSGEFILVLDADQIPAPDIARKTLGYFEDPELAFVQTPQYFYNIPPGDPFGSNAPSSTDRSNRERIGKTPPFSAVPTPSSAAKRSFSSGFQGTWTRGKGSFTTDWRALKKQVRHLSPADPKNRKEIRSIFREDIAEAERMLEEGKASRESAVGFGKHRLFVRSGRNSRHVAGFFGSGRSRLGARPVVHHREREPDNRGAFRGGKR